MGHGADLKVFALVRLKQKREKKLLIKKNVIVLLQRDGIRQRFAYATEC